MKIKYAEGIRKLILKEVVVIVSIMTIFAITCGTIFAISSSRNSMKYYLGVYQDQIDSYISTMKGMANTYALAMETGKLQGYKEELVMAQKVVESDKKVAAAYFCHSDESLTYYSAKDGAWLPKKGTIFTNREWYTGTENGEVYICEPYVDQVSGQPCITISKAVKINEKVVGVVGIDFLLGDIINLVASSDIGNGYLMLASGEGCILSHPNEELTMTAEHTSFLSDALNGKYNCFLTDLGEIQNFIDYSGGIKTSLSSKSEVSGWILVVVKPLASVYYGIGILMLVIAVFSIVANIICGKYNRKKCKQWFDPIETVSEKVPELAKGKLGIEFSEQTNIYEVDTLSASLNETVKQLKYCIQDITQIVAEIADYNLTVVSEAEYQGDFSNIQMGLNTILEKLNEMFSNIDKKADVVVSYASEIQKSSEMVAEGATEQAGAVSDLSKNVENLGEQIQLIIDNTQTTITSSRQTNEKLENGGIKMQEMEEAMTVIENTTNQIDDIMQSINAIAQQTNLLSLNASIEAARAGEAGRGFAVVAGEINTLATQCTEASNSIADLVEASKKAVSNGTEIARETALALKEGIDASISSERNLSEVQKAVNNQKLFVESIDKLSVEIVKVVETNAASAEENAAAGEELNRCAQDLKDYVGLFKLTK